LKLPSFLLTVVYPPFILADESIVHVIDLADSLALYRKNSYPISFPWEGHAGLLPAREINHPPGPWNHFKARKASLIQLHHMEKKKQCFSPYGFVTR
jgi:hypothetical protein